MRNVDNSIKFKTEQSSAISNNGINAELNYVDDSGRNNLSIFSNLSSSENSETKLKSADSIFGADLNRNYYEGKIKINSGAEFAYNNQKASGFEENNTEDINQSNKSFSLHSGIKYTLNNETQLGAKINFQSDDNDNTSSNANLNASYNPNSKINLSSSASYKLNNYENQIASNSQLSIGGDFAINNDTNLSGAASYAQNSSDNSKTSNLELGINKNFKPIENLNLKADAKYGITNDGLQEANYTKVKGSAQLDVSKNLQLNSSYNANFEEFSNSNTTNFGVKVLSDNKNMELNIEYEKENIQYKESNLSETSQKLKMNAKMNF